MKKGDLGWDTWLHGQYGSAICLHGGIDGVDDEQDVDLTKSIIRDEIMGSVVFGGMLTFLEDLVRESMRTNSLIEKVF